jgi:hypothetical protein
MSKKFRMGFMCSLFVLTLFSAPRLRAQQVDEKDSTDKSAPEQRIPEKRPVNTFSGHCELTTCVNKVFYLSNISQPTELQDFVNLMRTIGEIGRIQQIPSEQLVVVRGTPEQIAFAEQMADEINKDRRRFGGIGYRLEFKVNESEGTKKLRSRSYSLVTDGRETAKLSIERAVPPPSQNDAYSDKKQSSDAAMGRNIECHVVAQNERTIELFVEANFSNFGASGADKDGKDGLTGARITDPTVLHVRDRVVLELGKPNVIGMVDDPESERTFQLEVTATRVMEKQ